MELYSPQEVNSHSDCSAGQIRKQVFVENSVEARIQQKVSN